MPTAEVVSATVHSGAMDEVLKLTGAAGVPYVLTALPVDPAAPAVVSFWARADQPMGLRVDALGDVFGAEIPAEWTRLVFKIDRPAGTGLRLTPMAGGALYLYQGMVESDATLASDWTAAPEDTDGMIADSYATSQNVKAWFEFSAEGLRTRKQGSRWSTLVAEDGFFIDHDEVAGHVGAFYRETASFRSVQLARDGSLSEDIMIVRPTAAGGWVWTD